MHRRDLLALAASALAGPGAPRVAGPPAASVRAALSRYRGAAARISAASDAYHAAPDDHAGGRRLGALDRAIAEHIDAGRALGALVDALAGPPAEDNPSALAVDGALIVHALGDGDEPAVFVVEPGRVAAI